MTSLAARVAHARADGRLWHGAQLAVAVIAAYAVSSALHLPESLWAVMSALIVVRPNAGASVGAGGARLGGTVLGTLCGVGGVWLRQHGVDAAPATLLIVAALAFASATLPLIASAPVAALIILSSGSMPGHSALQVAWLRGAEVGIGVLVGLGVSLLLRAARAGARFTGACADLLEAFARPLDEEADAVPDSTVRSRLRELAVIAVQADRERAWIARLRRRPVERDAHVQLARMVSRVHQDSAVIARLLPGLQPDAAAPAAAIAQALRGAAQALRTRATPDLSMLASPRPAARIAGPVGLLAHDLRALAHRFESLHAAPAR